MIPPLAGKRFVLELGDDLGYLPWAKRNKLTQTIQKLGAKVDSIVNEEVDYVLSRPCTLQEYDGSIALHHAVKLGIPIVDRTFPGLVRREIEGRGNLSEREIEKVMKRIVQKTTVVFADEVQERQQAELEERSHFLSATADVDAARNTNDLDVSADCSNIQSEAHSAFAAKDDPSKYVVARRHLFATPTRFITIELHALIASEEHSVEKFPLRVFYQEGELRDAMGTSTFKEFLTRFRATADAAYKQLYTQATQHMSFEEMIGTCGAGIGSARFQQDCLSLTNSFHGKVSLPTQTASLVETLFKDSWSYLSSTTASAPSSGASFASSLSVLDLAKAEGALTAIGHILAKTTQEENHRDNDPSNTATLERLSTEFFSRFKPSEALKAHFPPSDTTGSIVINTPELLAILEDAIRALKLMNTTGEYVGGNIFAAPPEAQYDSLQTNISRVAPGSAEFSDIETTVVHTSKASDVSQSSPVRVSNIWRANKATENQQFKNTNIGNKKLLFHASKPGNWVGILRDGLQPPRVARLRRDRGMLGAGIYFGDRLETALRYSGVSSNGKSYVLCSEVALGREYRTTEHMYDLSKPPTGYDSVHGVRREVEASSSSKHSSKPKKTKLITQTVRRKKAQPPPQPPAPSQKKPQKPANARDSVVGTYHGGLGLSFGSTQSAISIWENERVEVIVNDQGNRTTPSVVGFSEGERLVGEVANNCRAANLKTTVMNVRDYLGKDFHDAEVQKGLAKQSCKVTPNRKTNACSFHTGSGKQYSPEELSSMIISNMKAVAEDYMALEVRRLVITVPAYFNDKQRQAVKDAATIAGLEVLRIINEPTAACIAYGLDRTIGEQDEECVVVVDYGGKSLDVSVIGIDGGIFEVKATAGSTSCGGQDIDEALVDHFAAEFKRKHKGKDVKKNPRALQRLRNQAERVKRRLSTQNDATLEIDGLMDDIDFTSRLPRYKLDAILASSNTGVSKVTQYIQEALTKAGITKGDVREIVLAGGSCRIPLIQKGIQDFFHGKEPNKSINPEEVCAYGAGVQAAILGSNDITYFDDGHCENDHVAPQEDEYEDVLETVEVDATDDDDDEDATSNHRSPTVLVDSAFRDDEFVVYDAAQQRMCYLLELEPLPATQRAKDDVTVSSTTMASVPSGFASNKTMGSIATVSNNRAAQDIPDVKLNDKVVNAALESANGRPVNVPLLRSRIKGKVVDLISEVDIFQQYYNAESSPIEAKYVFPLQTGATVCGFEAYINDKRVVGVVKEKEAARKEYKEAVARGDGAYLMEESEETQDVFTVAVGNIPPKCDVIIHITYVIELQVNAMRKAVEFSIPSSLHPSVADREMTRQLQNTVTAHVINEKAGTMGDAAAGGDVQLTLGFDMPFDITTIECSHILQWKRSACRATVSCDNVDFASNGDFIINVAMSVIDAPRIWVENNDALNSKAAMITFFPDLKDDAAETIKRTVSDPVEQQRQLKQLHKDSEVILLLDASASMSQGNAIDDAKTAAKTILESMPSKWHVSAVAVGPTPYACQPSTGRGLSHINTVKQFIDKTYGANMGCCDIAGTLESFGQLYQNDREADASQSSTTAITNLVFISDGLHDNDAALLQAAAKLPPSLRLFTVGVGSGCHAAGMSALAKQGRGAFEHLQQAKKSKWKSSLLAQLQRIRQPALGNVCVEWSTEQSQRLRDRVNATVVQTPSSLPSLFSGDATIVYGFVKHQARQCELVASHIAPLTGSRHELRSLVTVHGLSFRTGSLIHKLAARSRIKEFVFGSLSSDVAPSTILAECIRATTRQEIIDLGCQFSIVSPLTSMIAVEERTEEEKELAKKGLLKATTPSIDELAKKILVDGLPGQSDLDVPLLPTTMQLVDNTATSEALLIGGDESEGTITDAETASYSSSRYSSSSELRSLTPSDISFDDAEMLVEGCADSSEYGDSVHSCCDLGGGLFGPESAATLALNRNSRVQKMSMDECVDDLFGGGAHMIMKMEEAGDKRLCDTRSDERDYFDSSPLRAARAPAGAAAAAAAYDSDSESDYSDDFFDDSSADGLFDDAEAAAPCAAAAAAAAAPMMSERCMDLEEDFSSCDDNFADDLCLFKDGDDEDDDLEENAHWDEEPPKPQATSKGKLQGFFNMKEKKKKQPLSMEPALEQLEDKLLDEPLCMMNKEVDLADIPQQADSSLHRHKRRSNKKSSTFSGSVSPPPPAAAAAAAGAPMKRSKQTLNTRAAPSSSSVGSSSTRSRSNRAYGRFGLVGGKSKQTEGLLLLDVTPLSLGFDYPGNGGVMHTVIKRNTTIPTKKSVTVQDMAADGIFDYNAGGVQLHIYEGERAYTADNNKLGTVTVVCDSTLNSLHGGVEVTFDIDANGILSVTTLVFSTGATNTITITNDKGRLTKAEIEKMVNDAAKYEEEERDVKARAQLANASGDGLYQLVLSKLPPHMNQETLMDMFRDVKPRLATVHTDPATTWCSGIGTVFFATAQDCFSAMVLAVRRHKLHVVNFATIATYSFATTLFATRTAQQFSRNGNTMTMRELDVLFAMEAGTSAVLAETFQMTDAELALQLFKLGGCVDKVLTQHASWLVDVCRAENDVACGDVKDTSFPHSFTFSSATVSTLQDAIEEALRVEGVNPSLYSHLKRHSGLWDGALLLPLQMRPVPQGLIVLDGYAAADDQDAELQALADGHPRGVHVRDIWGGLDPYNPSDDIATAAHPASRDTTPIRWDQLKLPTGSGASLPPPPPPSMGGGMPGGLWDMPPGMPGGNNSGPKVEEVD